MNLLRKLFPSRSRQRGGAPPSALPLPYRHFTLQTWRASPERVAYVAELLRQPLFLDLLGMLANQRVLHRFPIDSTTASILLGARMGHDQVIASLLEAGTTATTLADLPPPDYGAENLLASWEHEGDMNTR